MQELDKVLDKEEDRQYFLGIIDGDARKQRRDFPEKNDLLYILQYYSWESYFINREVVSKSIKDFLKTRSLLTQKSIDYIYTHYIEKYLFDELWLCALKRLRDGDSDEMCNNDNSINRLDKDNQFIKQLKELQNDLSQFAIDNQLICNHKTLLEITKGKWGLNFFIKKYLQALKELPNLCKNGSIITCDYCNENDIKIVFMS